MATLIAFVAMTCTMAAASIGSGWGALGIAMFVSPAVNLLLALISAGYRWMDDREFSAFVVLPFGFGVASIVIVFWVASELGGGGC